MFNSFNLLKEVTNLLDKNNLRVIVESDGSKCTLKMPPTEFPKKKGEILAHFSSFNEKISIKHFSDGVCTYEADIECAPLVHKSYILLSVVQYCLRKNYPLQYIKFQIKEKEEKDEEEHGKHTRCAECTQCKDIFEFHSKFLGTPSTEEDILFRAANGMAEEHEVEDENIMAGIAFLQECFASTS